MHIIAAKAVALKEAKRISKKIIILDYKIPSPLNRTGIAALYYEFVAGYDHLSHYLDYWDKGGLDYYLNEAGLKRENEITAQKETLEIVNAI